MEWFALAIPLVGMAIAWYWFPHELKWWELFIPVVASGICIFLGRYLGQFVQTTDLEYWTGYCVCAEHYEDWNERVPCRHPKYKTVTRDGKTSVVFDGFQHFYDVDYHPEYWEILDNNALRVRISKQEFQELTERWQNKRFVDLHRFYHTDDGDKYVTSWPGDDSTMEVVTTSHRYENRPQSAQSVFNFPEVSEQEVKDFGLVEYPKVVGHTAPAILGVPTPDLPQAERQLSIVNAKLGKPNEIRICIIVYRNQPLQASFLQEAYWKGGNMNELVLTIGVDSSNLVQWARSFSWTEQEEAKVRFRNLALEQSGKPLSLLTISQSVTPIIQNNWKRRDFDKDFSYLKVDPPLWTVLLTYFVAMASTVGSIWWCVNNEFDDERLGISRYS